MQINYIGYCESKTLPFFSYIMNFCVVHLSLLNRMCKGSFVLAKYCIVSYTVVFNHNFFRIFTGVSVKIENFKRITEKNHIGIQCWGGNLNHKSLF